MGDIRRPSARPPITAAPASSRTTVRPTRPQMRPGPRRVVAAAVALAAVAASCAPTGGGPTTSEAVPAPSSAPPTAAPPTTTPPGSVPGSEPPAPEPGPLPVFPGAEGFGTDTPAGRGGVIHLVTSLADAGPGTLRACVEATGPRVCLFEVSGEIRLAEDLVIMNPYLTIAGQTAPPPGITVRDRTTVIHAHDVLIQHVRFRAGDAVPHPDPDGWGDHDAVEVSSRAYNVVLDHNTFSWGVDETLSIFAVNDVTVSSSIIAEGLHESFHPKGPHHSKGLMVASGSERISLLRNLIVHNHDRNPMVSGSEVEMVNNLVYNWAFAGLALVAKVDQRGNVRPTVQASVVGNVYLDGPDTPPSRPPVAVHENTPGLFSGDSRIHLADLRRNDTVPDDPWTLVLLSVAEPANVAGATTPPVWSAPTVMPSALVEDHVLAHAGARPADRDTADARVIASVRSRTGGIINCVDADPTRPVCDRNAGGWPSLPQTHRPLQLPPDPTGDDDADGYTNLEEWLHELSRALDPAG